MKKEESLWRIFFPEHIENLSGILKALDSKEKEKMIKLCKKLGKSIDKI